MRFGANVAYLVIILSLAGCGSGQYDTASVKGRVTANGKPVTEGQVFFTPIYDEKSDRGINPGKSAFADIDAEGNYELSTYGDGDGAVIGRHEVSYIGPVSESEADEDRPASYIVPPDQAEKEVAAGSNEINIELIPNPEAKGWRPQRTIDD